MRASVLAGRTAPPACVSPFLRSFTHTWLCPAARWTRAAGGAHGQLEAWSWRAPACVRAPPRASLCAQKRVRPQDPYLSHSLPSAGHTGSASSASAGRPSPRGPILGSRAQRAGCTGVPLALVSRRLQALSPQSCCVRHLSFPETLLKRLGPVTLRLEGGRRCWAEERRGSGKEAGAVFIRDPSSLPQVPAASWLSICS